MAGTKIKLIREEYELTQKEMAANLNVSRSAYSLWEINKNIIPLIKLIELCNYFSLSIDYVCGLSNIKTYEELKCENININELGKKLKQVRKELKLTQEKLAKHLGTTHSAISAYENGVTLIPTLFLIEFSKISNIPIDYFVGRTSNKTTQKELTTT